MKHRGLGLRVKGLVKKTTRNNEPGFLYPTPYTLYPKGAILMLSLVFLGIFVFLGVGLVSMVDMQRKLTVKKVSYNQAMQIAEAGLNYYRWHLAHAPNDYQDGTGTAGPYIHDYLDPYGSAVGQFSLTITPPGAGCNDAVSITSTGWTNASPNTKRRVRVQYGQHSLTAYAFLANSDLWFGPGEAVHGALHSNGGIRMDGTHDAVVTSAKTTYTCGSNHGCTPSQSKPGVWGSGGTPNLWQFPAQSVDFNAITADLPNLKSLSQTQNLYYPNLGQGYRIVFLANGTFSVYRVKRLRNPVNYYDGERNRRNSWDILEDELIENRAIPSGCGIIFIEDYAWVEGVINGKVTLVAAKLPENPASNRSIVINGNITYASKDGSSVLGLIAQDSVIVPLYAAPNNLEINAAVMAQRGSVVRYHYTNVYNPYHLRNSLTHYGAIVTNKFWTWTWVNGGTVISGYQTTNTTYDPYLTYNPPPGFPKQGDYSILRWEDVTEK